jgi:hypothetical protein
MSEMDERTTSILGCIRADDRLLSAMRHFAEVLRYNHAQGWRNDELFVSRMLDSDWRLLRLDPGGQADWIAIIKACQ